MLTIILYFKKKLLGGKNLTLKTDTQHV